MHRHIDTKSEAKHARAQVYPGYNSHTNDNEGEHAGPQVARSHIHSGNMYRTRHTNHIPIVRQKKRSTGCTQQLPFHSVYNGKHTLTVPYHPSTTLPTTLHPRTYSLQAGLRSSGRSRRARGRSRDSLALLPWKHIAAGHKSGKRNTFGGHI